MRCPQCRKENPPHARFCVECAGALAVACAECGTTLGPGFKFCPECGVPTRPARFVSAGAPHVAEEAVEYEPGLDSERKQVTVLFADIKGSMELLAERDPEEARTIIDPVLERMIEAVRHYEGTVNQVMGDGIMALFGAPVAREDHAVRGCYAALRIQEKLREYVDQLRPTQGIAVRARVGLNSGEVIVRAIAGGLHTDYSALGLTTHLAARMEQLATPGAILVTADTARLVEGFVQLKPLGPVGIKGLSGPIEVYEVTDAGPVRSRLQAAARRGLSRFVGRDAELVHLARALDSAGEGRGQVVAVVGEPGVGKSRLVWEFTRSPRTQGWSILESGPDSPGKATSYVPVLHLLKAYFGIDARDGQREICEKITSQLRALGPALTGDLPALLALLGVAVDDPDWLGLGAAQRRSRSLDALKRLFLRQSQEQPLLLVFEDLHWIDSETQALLDLLIESLPTARILLVVTYRQEYQHQWGNKTYYTQLRLDALSSEIARELLRALLGDDDTLEPLKQMLITGSEGNPFFMEESVQTLIETGALVGEPGAYRLARVLQAIQVPPTVQATLAARIDRLPAADKRLLQAMAVIGKDVPFALLEATADLPEPALRRGLADLQAAEFIYEKSLFPELEYTFKHALTHEVAYGSLPLERRRSMHARIMQAIESLHKGRLTEHVEPLSHHAVRGGVWNKAVEYLRQAGAKAFDRSANREAVAYFEQALAALAQLAEHSETIRQAIDLRFDLRNALHALGEFGRVVDCLREAERLAEGLGDQRRLGWAFVYQAQLSSMMLGDHDRAIAAGHRALAIAEGVADLGLQVVANFNLGLANFLLGNYRHAMEFQRRTFQSLSGELLRERFGLAGLPAVFAQAYLAWSLAQLGQFAEGIECAREGARIANEVAHPYSQVHAGYCLGYIHLRRGDAASALPPLEDALTLCCAKDIRALLPYVTSALGFAYARADRVSEALPLLEQAIQASSPRIMSTPSFLVGFLGEAHLLAGRMEEAAELGRRALDLAQERKERGYEAWTLRLLGEIHARRDPVEVEGAERRFHQALAIAEKLGLRPLAAHCHLGLGALYRRTGARAKAEECFRTALGMYREMVMRSWPDEAEAELQRLR